ncbi:hypothetical protein C8R45DRAFT_769177, partial [Mycena sanguinolenta]
LPSKPKLFYGRESELEQIMDIVVQNSPRIAILGGGEMGKSTLARAVLHHPETSAKFEGRFFVSAETATSSMDLVTLIGSHIGLGPGEDLTKPVLQYFSRASHSLLILDNLETVWDPMQSRHGVEEFLSLLTDIPDVALIVTMRGAERPAKVHWSRPFLSPLNPLANEATQQMFIDITDGSCTSKDMGQLLQLTDNIPIAVDLIAHLAEYESCDTILARWKAQKTTILSVGYDRTSNLAVSINLSLSSPRLTPDSKTLLSLLSILPDGLSDLELRQSNFSIENILTCKATLLSTSLAYQDDKMRLRSLIPIREHMLLFLPPAPSLIHSLRKHFYSL